MRYFFEITFERWQQTLLCTMKNYTIHATDSCLWNAQKKINYVMSMAASFFLPWISHYGNALYFMARDTLGAPSLPIFRQINEFRMRDTIWLIFQFKSVARIPFRTRIKYQKQNPLEIRMSTKMNIFCLVRQLLSPKFQMTVEQRNFFFQFPVRFNIRFPPPQLLAAVQQVFSN